MQKKMFAVYAVGVLALAGSIIAGFYCELVGMYGIWISGFWLFAAVSESIENIRQKRKQKQQ